LCTDRPRCSGVTELCGCGKCVHAALPPAGQYSGGAQLYTPPACTRDAYIHT
jgi:hypothetical protein